MTIYFIILAIVTFISLTYIGKGYIAWVSAAIIFAAAWLNSGVESHTLFDVYFVSMAVIATLFAIPALRRPLISATVMKLMAKAMPKIGETEQIALDAGTVGFDGDLFSGNPNWKALLDKKIKSLTKEEKAFLDGPCEELCAMLDDEDIAKRRDLPPKVWTFIKKNKFFGMLISKKHGGLGFSAAAQSAVIIKVSSRSGTAAVTIMVPNSLGPGELLMHYGTEAQQKQYLPNLAIGKEVPCFALTEPTAGSDAANGQSVGIICKGQWKGKEIIGMKLTFDKRYITLAPVATVVGLAFKALDPEGLLGKKVDLGITCALLPRTTEGLEIGNRHDPMGVPFQNGPVRGKDIFVPLDYIIGGEKNIGTGWKMLMECLAAGRGISLPSLSVGAVKTTARATTAYGAVREQFGMPVGNFEGVQEPLARIAGFSYMMDAARELTCGAIDEGQNPSVLSAVVKAYLTSNMRKCVNDGMDIFAGAAICKGQRNIFARPYNSIPIGITVEGANILTRSLIIFGQGAIRCHPFVQDEVQAIKTGDIHQFDKAFFGHINHFAKNKTRSIVNGFTCGFFCKSPVRGYEAKYYKSLTRFSSIFAFATDVALLTLGGALKRKESLSGRYADALSYMYLASATLKKFNDRGRNPEERPLLDWAMAKSLHETEEALIDICRNMPNRFIGKLLLISCFPYGSKHHKPNDKQMHAVIKSISDNSQEIRNLISDGIYIPKPNKQGLGAIEDAYQKVLLAADIREKIKAALKKGMLSKDTVINMATKAKEEKLITADEFKKIQTAEKAKLDVIQVNDFTPEEYNELR